MAASILKGLSFPTLVVLGRDRRPAAGASQGEQNCKVSDLTSDGDGVASAQLDAGAAVLPARGGRASSSGRRSSTS